MGELRRGAGSQWNPKVVEAALAALQQEEESAAPVTLAAVPAGA
jgi:HD-GYP domain-containing protein (c-di-GMP phosphodiesterase class II)